MIRPLHVNEQTSVPRGAQSVFMSTNEIRTAHVYLNNNAQYDRPKIFHIL